MWFFQPSLTTPVLCGLLFPGVVAAQGIRLENKVERPLVYLTHRAPGPGGFDVLSAMQSDVLRALGLAANRDVKEVDAGSVVLHSVQRLLSRLSVFSNRNELALVGMLPLRGGEPTGRPLMVFHSELRKEGADEMARLLADDQLTEVSRKLHGRTVHRLRLPEASRTTTASPQRAVEVALVGRDLLVSNDPDTMTTVLDPKTTASSGFGRSAAYRQLRQKLTVPEGAVLGFADWPALRPSVFRLFGDDAEWLMHFSGLRRLKQVMFVAKPTGRSAKDRGVATTLLLSHESPSYTLREGRKRGRRSAVKPARTKTGASEWRPDGWLDLVRAGRAQRLVNALPGTGFLAMTASLDFERLLRSHPGRHMRRLQAQIFRNCQTHKVNLRHQVLRRLNEVGGAQLVFVDGAGSAARFAYSLQAKSDRKARDVFSELKKAYAETGDAEIHKIGDLTALQFRGGRSPMVLAVVHDRLFFAYDSAVLKALVETCARQRRSPERRRRNAAIADRLQRLGASRLQKVAGIFALDLRSLLPEGIGAAQTNSTRSGAMFRGLFGLHGGCVSLERDLVRLEVFTQL